MVYINRKHYFSFFKLDLQFTPFIKVLVKSPDEQTLYLRST